MGRNLSPKWKRYRRLGLEVPGGKNKRAYPPGQHGPKQQRPRLTEYGIQLREKQRAKLLYGIMEKQIRKYYQKASASQGNTGAVLLQLLETRLDNVVYRAGFGKTRSQSRQLVTHGHFLVNGRRCDIPSRQIKVGDVIELREKSQKSPLFADLKEDLKHYSAPAWLTVEQDAFKITVQGEPGVEDAEQQISINLIVEFYSR